MEGNVSNFAKVYAEGREDQMRKWCRTGLEKLSNFLDLNTLDRFSLRVQMTFNLRTLGPVNFITLPDLENFGLNSMVSKGIGIGDSWYCL